MPDQNSGVPATWTTSKSEFSNSCTLLAPSMIKHCSCFRYFFTCRDLMYLIFALDSIIARLITTKSKYFILILVPLFLSGCLGTKHLKENQRQLISQSIK